MTTAVATRDERAEKYAAVRDFLTTRKSQISAIAGKALDTERVLKICLDAASGNSDLLDCTPESLLRSLLYCAKLGLEPLGAWGVHLVPYRNKHNGGRFECTPITDYRGLITLVTRSGKVKTISAHVVYESDKLDVEFGDNEHLIHKPSLVAADKRGPMTAAYAIATLADGDKQRAFLTRSEVDRIGSKSRAGPWVTDYEAMALKTAIRALCNKLPVTFEVREAITDGDKHEFGDSASMVIDTQADDVTPELAGGAGPALPAVTQEPLPTATRAEAMKAELRAQKAEAEKTAAQRVIEDARAANPPPEPRTLPNDPNPNSPDDLGFRTPSPSVAASPQAIQQTVTVTATSDDDEAELRDLDAKRESLWQAFLAANNGDTMHARKIWSAHLPKVKKTVKGMADLCEKASALVERARIVREVQLVKAQINVALGGPAEARKALEDSIDIRALDDLFGLDLSQLKSILVAMVMIVDEHKAPDLEDGGKEEPGADG